MAVLAVCLAVVVASCGDDDSGSTTTSAVVDATNTSAPTAPATTTPPSTSPPTTAAVSPFADLFAAGAELEAYIEANAVPAEVLGAGTLLENGAFADDLERDLVPQVAFDVRGFVDEEGIVWIVLLGDMTAISNAWYEFDAVAADGFTVVAEASLIGTGEGPPWVETAPQGIVVEIGDPPSLTTFQSLQGDNGDVVFVDGLALRTGIRTDQEWDHISGWVYASLGLLANQDDLQVAEAAKYLYEHFRLDFEDLVSIDADAAVGLLEAFAREYTEELVGRGLAEEPPEEILNLLDHALAETLEDVGGGD